MLVRWKSDDFIFDKGLYPRCKSWSKSFTIVFFGWIITIGFYNWHRGFDSFFVRLQKNHWSANPKIWLLHGE